MRQAVDDLDDTIRELRSAIFELHTARLAGRSVRQELLDICAQAARALGFEPMVRFDGPIDNSVDDALADHLLAVLREALSNVARHAAATSVIVEVAATEGLLSLMVDDNGTVGFKVGAGGRGIDNMRARATRLGGTMSIEPRDVGGTRVQRQVALSQSS
jgi:two-component system, NarL family, sensor histidine kinase DevS